MKSVHYESTKTRDLFIKLLMHCNEFEITSLVNDLHDMERLFKTYNPLLGKVFDEKCFITNYFCKSIENLDLEVSKSSDTKKTHVVPSNVSVINSEIIKEKIEYMDL